MWATTGPGRCCWTARWSTASAAPQSARSWRYLDHQSSSVLSTLDGNCKCVFVCHFVCVCLGWLCVQRLSHQKSHSAGTANRRRPHRPRHEGRTSLAELQGLVSGPAGSGGRAKAEARRSNGVSSSVCPADGAGEPAAGVRPCGGASLQLRHQVDGGALPSPHTAGQLPPPPNPPR